MLYITYKCPILFQRKLWRVFYCQRTLYIAPKAIFLVETGYENFEFCKISRKIAFLGHFWNIFSSLRGRRGAIEISTWPKKIFADHMIDKVYVKLWIMSIRSGEFTRKTPLVGDFRDLKEGLCSLGLSCKQDKVEWENFPKQGGLCKGVFLVNSRDCL